MTLNANTTYLQRRVSSPCAAGSSIRVIGSDGSVTCEPDDDTTYSAGNQLNLVDTTFNVVEGAGSGLDADLLDGQHDTFYRNASNIDAGTLDNARFSAYSDLGAEGYLDNSADADLPTRVQADGRYVNEGQTDSVTSAMIVNGAVSASDMQDGAALAEILDDDGTGSGLDADTLDGRDSNEFAAANHTHSGTLMNIYRVQVFGHAHHSSFYCTSTSYEAVPNTFAAQSGQFPAPVPGTQRRYRVEVSFAVNWDRVIYLRMRDPANNLVAWEHSFQGGHAPNSWWSWGTTPRFSVWNPWPRQYQLEMRASDTSGAYLGSVWIVAEDIQ